MKPSAPDSRILVCAVLPPVLAERIRRHYKLLYGDGFTASDAFTSFLFECITDAGFRERLQAKASELQGTVFDSQDPSWGIWPIDPEECTGIGFLLGLSLKAAINDYLADLPQASLALLKKEAVGSQTSLDEIFVQMLIEAKSAATDPADWWECN